MKKLVFFSGGTALASLAKVLARRGYSPIYIITTFDSGGSTQALRRVFDIPAVGDLRNRLLAAVDMHACPQEIVSFLKSRLVAEKDLAGARKELIARVENASLDQFEEWRQINQDLKIFIENMPAMFDARRASLGNLALTGNWLANGNSMHRAIDCYSELLHVKAQLVPVCEQSLHLGIRLKNGQVLVGQHLLHDRQAAPVQTIFLTSAIPWSKTCGCEEACPAAETEVIAAILQADIICFPMGSFYSSLLATLLPVGIGKAVAASSAIKIFIPNSGADIEMGSMSVSQQIHELIKMLKRDATDACARDILNLVLIDSANGKYSEIDYKSFEEALIEKGIYLLDRAIIGTDGKHNPDALLAVLEGLAEC